MAELLQWIPLNTLAWALPSWLLACYFFAWAGGWERLAEVYSDRGKFRGERFRHRSGAFGDLGAYENTLTFGVDDDGLRIRVMFFLRPWHPCLFVPWREVTAECEKNLLGGATVLTFRRAPEVTLRISDTLAEELLEQARGKYNVNLGASATPRGWH